MATVCLVGAVDTKHAEYAWPRGQVRAGGADLEEPQRSGIAVGRPLIPRPGGR